MKQALMLTNICHWMPWPLSYCPLFHTLQLRQKSPDSMLIHVHRCDTGSCFLELLRLISSAGLTKNEKLDTTLAPCSWLHVIDFHRVCVVRSSVPSNHHNLSLSFTVSDNIASVVCPAPRQWRPRTPSAPSHVTVIDVQDIRFSIVGRRDPKLQTSNDHEGWIINEDSTEPPPKRWKFWKLFKGSAAVLGQNCLVRVNVAPYCACAKLATSYDKTSITVVVCSRWLSEEWRNYRAKWLLKKISSANFLRYVSWGVIPYFSPIS